MKKSPVHGADGDLLICKTFRLDDWSSMSVFYLTPTKDDPGGFGVVYHPADVDPKGTDPNCIWGFRTLDEAIDDGLAAWADDPGMCLGR